MDTPHCPSYIGGKSIICRLNVVNLGLCARSGCMCMFFVWNAGLLLDYWIILCIIAVMNIMDWKYQCWYRIWIPLIVQARYSIGILMLFVHRWVHIMTYYMYFIIEWKYCNVFSYLITTGISASVKCLYNMIRWGQKTTTTGNQYYSLCMIQHENHLHY